MDKIHKSEWTLIKQQLRILLWLSIGQTSDSIAFQSVYWWWPPIFALSGYGCSTHTKKRSTHFSLQDETAEVMSSNRINQSTLANTNTKRRQNNRKKYRVHLPLVHIESCFFSCCSVSRSPWLLLGAMKTTLNIHKTNLEGATIIYEQKATENCVRGVRWSINTPHRLNKMQHKVVNIQNKKRISKEKRNILRLLLLCFAQTFMLLGVYFGILFCASLI